MCSTLARHRPDSPILGPVDAGTEARRIRLLTHPMRLRMLELIRDSADGRTHVSRIADELGVPQPTASRHMRALVDDGVIECSTEGQRVLCSIAPGAANRVDDLLQADVPAHAPDEMLAQTAAELADRFEGVFAPETVGRYVRESHDLLVERGGASRHLPSRTAQFAADRLNAIASLQAPWDRRVPEVLFVCVENAGRSQLAAAILNHLGGDRVHVRTAGSAPASEVRPTIVAALAEIDVPLGGAFPKPLTDEVVRAADVVVTMGCGDACPVYPGPRYLDWELEDPAGLPLTGVRRIRDDIERRVRELLAELDSSRARREGAA